MSEERITESPSWSYPRGQEMKTPDDVTAMLRLKGFGWGTKRIARWLGCSHHTVKHYVATSGPLPFRSPKRAKALDGHEDWLRERFIRHGGNADVVRQVLLFEKGLAVGLRTLQRALRPYRQALQAEALACLRFETPPGRQLQIDSGERLVEIDGADARLGLALGARPIRRTGACREVPMPAKAMNLSLNSTRRLAASWRTTRARGLSISTSSGTPPKLMNALSSPENQLSWRSCRNARTCSRRECPSVATNTNTLILAT